MNNGKGVFSLWGVLQGSGFTWGEFSLNSVAAADLDGDRYPEIALTTGIDDGVTIYRNLTTPPHGADQDGNGVLDECEKTHFRRGDWNQDGRLNLSDAVSLIDYLFRGGERFPCTKAGDADDSGRLNITDPIRILLYLFRSGAAPAEPFTACGKDPTADSLSCLRFAPCE